MDREIRSHMTELTVIADEWEHLTTVPTVPVAILYHTDTVFIIIVWLSRSPSFILGLISRVKRRLFQRPSPFIITVRVAQPDPDLLSLTVDGVCDVLQVVHVGDGGQIGVILSAVSLSFAPFHLSVHKVILMQRTR